MNAHKLLPCPFCGGEAQSNDGGNSVYGRLWYSVWCVECHVEMNDREKWDGEGKLSLPAKECFARWNRRGAIAQLGGAADDLHNLIKVTFADMTIERMNEVCKQVLAMRAVQS